MAIPFLSNIDLKKNQITNVAVHNATSDLSTPSTGQIYFNTGTSTPGLRIYNGSAWVPVGKYTDLNFNLTDGTNSRVVRLREGTTEIDFFTIVSATGIGSIAVGGTGDNVNLSVNNGAIDLTKMAGSAIITSTEGVSTSTSNDTSVPTTAAIKSYVDTVTTGALVYQGGVSLQSTSPPTGSTILKGFTYTVTSAGTGTGFFSNALEVGDLIIAEQDNPTAEAHWTAVQKDIQVATASTIGYGNTAAATSDELDGLRVNYSSGTATVGLDISSLTANSSLPSNLANIQIPVFHSKTSPANEKLGLDDIIDAVRSNNSVAGTIASGSTSGTITHNFDTYDVIVQIFDLSTKETVYADIDRNTVNTVTVVFASATANNVRVLIQKIG